MQKALPLFNDNGSIFLNGSVASIKGFPAFGVYSASKAALRAFARCWLVELKDRKDAAQAVFMALQRAEQAAAAAAQVNLFVG